MDQSPAQSGQPRKAPGNQFRVLIVDDDMMVHGEIQSVLESIGITEFRSCMNTTEALKVLSGFYANVIVLDIPMQGLAGLNFLKQVRAGHAPVDPGTPVVITSQTLDAELAQRACDAGIHNFVRKPIAVENFKKRLVAALLRPSLFVTSKSYFGPDRRTEREEPYTGQERRGVEPTAEPKEPKKAVPREAVKPPEIKEAPKREAVKAPEHFPGGKRPSGGGTVLPDAPKQDAEAPKEDIPLVDESPESKEPEKIETAEPSKKEKAEAPPKPPAKKEEAKRETPQKEKKAAPEPTPEPEKTEPIETAPAEEPPEEPDDEPGEPEVDVAAVISDHETWLRTKGAQGAKANLEGIEVPGNDFSGANLASANLRNAVMPGANLTGTDMLDADLRNADIRSAKLQEANLHNAKLRHAALSLSNFKEAGLRGADLAGADLRGADLTGVDFKDANLLSTDLRGAILLGENLTQKQIDKARVNKKTKLPPGLKIPEKS